MNKLTKVLSVFLLAGALGASVAGATACKTTGGHTHKYDYTVNATDSAKHDGHCAVDGCDKPDITEAHHWNDQDKCKECGTSKPTTPTGDKLKIPAEATKLIVEGIQTETINLSTTKTSHDIPKSEIKVYFGNNSGKIGEAIPEANYTLRLQAPGAVTITDWTGLKTHGDYIVRVNVKDCEITEGSTSNMEPEDFFANVTITINNPVTTLSVKEGATLTQVAGPNTISAGWQFEITRANGDKTDVAASNVTFTTPVDTVSAGENKTAEFKTTVDGKEVTGSVNYTVTADTSKVSQSFAFNFGSFTAEQTAAIAAGEKVTLQGGRFEVQSVGSGSIDNHNNSIGTKYFTKRLKTNGSSTAYDTANSKATPRYIKVHADGAGTLTVYAFNNGGTLGDNNTRGVTVYSGVTFVAEGDQKGRLQITDATMVGEAKQIPSKSGDMFSVSIPEAGDYYITNDAAMTYCYVQLDQLVSAEGNEAITLTGNKVYTKLSASHTDDTEEVKFSKTYGVGDIFEVDAGYTFKAEASNDVTCESYDKETITEGLTYWIGNIEITSGYTFTASDLGPQTVTVKLGGVSANISITVESAISGVTGITAEVTGVNGAVTSADATVNLSTANISVGVAGTNDAATATLVSATYKLKNAEGEGTALTTEGVALAVGEYEITVVGNVAVGEGAPSQFTTTISFSVVNTSNLQNVVAGATETAAIKGTYTANVDLVSNANGKIFITASGDGNVVIEDNNKTIDGTKYTQRIKLGGTGTTTYRSIGFEVKQGATIVVYAISSSSSAARDSFILDSNGNKLSTTAVSVAGDAAAKYEFTVEEAGTYYFIGEGGGINVYGASIIYNA